VLKAVPTGLMDIDPDSGVYLWLAEIQDQTCVVYIGSSTKNVRDRQAQSVEQILGGGWWLIEDLFRFSGR
jgi:hypothetical protein